MNKQAANLEVIYKAKQKHDAECPWGGEGKRLLMTHFDIERMGWEESDNIAGLVIMSSSSVATGRFRVECDAEPTAPKQITEDVKDEDLVTV